MSDYPPSQSSSSSGLPSSSAGESRPLLSQEERGTEAIAGGDVASSFSTFPRVRPIQPYAATSAVSPPLHKVGEGGGGGMQPMGDEVLQYTSPSKEARFIRCLPVAFVVILIAALYCIYVLYHCIPLLQVDVPVDQRNTSAYYRGLGELIAFNVLTFLLIVAFGLAIFTPPGEIPDTNEWNIDEEEEENNLLASPLRPTENPAGGEQEETAASAQETKRKGGKRKCKWCAKYKPDRTHHCRICRRCILKMDHHCPWIYNCVGWGNHKYFILSLLYGSILSVFLAATMFESVKQALDQPIVPFDQMFLLLFGETLDLFLGVIVVGFFGFHIWLLSFNITTIEFCEKRTVWQQRGTPSLWNRGCWQNFKDVFGANPLLWFLPIDNRSGDGLHFVMGSSGVSEDVESSGAPSRLLSRNIKSRKQRKQSL